MTQIYSKFVLILLTLLLPATDVIAQTLSADLARESSICRRLAEARDLDSDLLSTACEKLRLASQAPSPSPEIHQTLKSCEALNDDAVWGEIRHKADFIAKISAVISDLSESHPVSLQLTEIRDRYTPKEVSTT